MKYFRHMLCVFFVFCLCTGPVATGNAGTVQEVKKGAKSVWSEVKQAAKDTGKAVKDGAVKVGKGAKKGYQDTKEAVKKRIKGEENKEGQQ